MAAKPPRIDPAVVAWLETVFPDRCPNETDSNRAIWIAVGAQRVIKKLRYTLNETPGTLLDDDDENEQEVDG